MPFQEDGRRHGLNLYERRSREAKYGCMKLSKAESSCSNNYPSLETTLDMGVKGLPARRGGSWADNRS
jgi:hypothetical protein